MSSPDFKRTVFDIVNQHAYGGITTLCVFPDEPTPGVWRSAIVGNSIFNLGSHDKSRQDTLAFERVLGDDRFAFTVDMTHKFASNSFLKYKNSFPLGSVTKLPDCFVDIHQWKTRLEAYERTRNTLISWFCKCEFMKTLLGMCTGSVGFITGNQKEQRADEDGMWRGSTVPYEGTYYAGQSWLVTENEEDQRMLMHLFESGMAYDLFHLKGQFDDGRITWVS